MPEESDAVIAGLRSAYSNVSRISTTISVTLTLLRRMVHEHLLFESSAEVQNLIREDHSRVVKLCDWLQLLRQIGPDVVTFTDETQITDECQQRKEFAFSSH